jgi:ankyrin repeat protein
MGICNVWKDYRCCFSNTFFSQVFGMHNDCVREGESSASNNVREIESLKKTAGLISSSLKSQALMQAIIGNDIDRVDQLLTEGVDVNASFDHVVHPLYRGLTPLMVAVGFDREEIVKKLLNHKGIQVNKKKFFGAQCFNGRDLA